MQRSEIINIAKKYAEHLKKSGIPLDFLYVFGSYIKGSPHKWSDIDIAVVSPYLNTKYTEGRFKLWRLRRDIDMRIEPHGFTPGDWSDKANPLSYEIKNTGVQVI